MNDGWNVQCTREPGQITALPSGLPFLYQDGHLLEHANQLQFQLRFSISSVDLFVALQSRCNENLGMGREIRRRGGETRRK